MANKAKESASGFFVNPVKVKCGKCGGTLYIDPRWSGGWECPRCGKHHA